MFCSCSSALTPRECLLRRSTLVNQQSQRRQRHRKQIQEQLDREQVDGLAIDCERSVSNLGARQCEEHHERQRNGRASGSHTNSRPDKGRDRRVQKEWRVGRRPDRRTRRPATNRISD